MRRTSFASWPCGIARTLDVVGDPWTPLVLREAFYGLRRFEDLQSSLGIARSTLSDRLALLVEHGLLTREQYASDPVRHEYVLTEKGRDLQPVLLALMAYGNRWLADDAGPAVQVRHRSHHHGDHVATPELVCGECHEPVTPDDVEMVMGPGFPERLRDQPEVRRRFHLDAAAS